MLTLEIPPGEFWDENKQEFISIKGARLQLEHSLVSISKWESKWKKAFITNKNKTFEETIDYIKCMTITQNVDPMIYMCIGNEQINKVNEYIEDPHSATIVNLVSPSSSKHEVVTSEVIYYWMISLNIPVDICQKWHLNRLLTLIQVFNAKNPDAPKMSKSDILKRNAQLNAKRRAALNTKG